MNISEVNERPARDVYFKGQEALVKIVEGLGTLKMIRDTLDQNYDEENTAKRFCVDMQVLQAEFLLDEIFSQGLRAHIKANLAKSNERATANGHPNFTCENVREWAQETIQDFLDKNDLEVAHPGCGYGSCDHQQGTVNGRKEDS